MEVEQLNTRIPKELKTELKKIALREDKKLEDIVIEQLTQFAKIHGDGNPTFELDRWIEQPKFKSDPAFRRTAQTWQEYIENNKSNDDLQEILFQAQSIASFAQKKIKYGSTNVKVF